MKSNLPPPKSWAEATGEPKVTISVWVENENMPKQLSFPPSTTLTQVVRSKWVKVPEYNINSVSAYGLSLSPTTTLTEFLQNNADGMLFVTHQRVGIFLRDHVFADKRQKYTQIINERLKEHWESYSHCNCTLAGYTAALLKTQTGRDQSITTTKVESIMSRLNGSGDKLSLETFFLGKQGEDEMIIEGDVSKEIAKFLRWDSSSGDCSSSHIVFKEKLERDVRLPLIKWNVHHGGQHAMLVGTLLDSSTFLVDVGTIRECVSFPGSGVHQYSSLLGRINSSTEPKTEWKVEKQFGFCARIFMKVYTTCSLKLAVREKAAKILLK